MNYVVKPDTTSSAVWTSIPPLDEVTAGLTRPAHLGSLLRALERSSPYLLDVVAGGCSIPPEALRSALEGMPKGPEAERFLAWAEQNARRNGRSRADCADLALGLAYLAREEIRPLAGLG